MSDLGEMIRHESAHSGLAFRARSYEQDETVTLVRDLIALANASVTGPRFLIIGVEDAQGETRRLAGINRSAIAELQRRLPAAATRYIEPPLKVTVRGCEIDSVLVAIAVLQRCNDPPYLLKVDVSESAHVGRGWIRRGVATHPLMRSDLQRMFTQHAPTPAPRLDIEIGFPGKLPRDEICLPALPLDEMPSQLAAQRLKRLLEGKQRARDVLGRTETQLNRLLHMQLYGSNATYETHSDDSLRQRLELVADQHAAADRRYEFEERAHELQLMVRNASDVAINNAMLTLKIPRIEAMGISETRTRESGDRPAATGLPIIDSTTRHYTIQTDLGTIPKQASLPVFRQPPRLWVREGALGKTILLEYVVHCRQLQEPLTGALRIHVEQASTPQQPASRS